MRIFPHCSISFFTALVTWLSPGAMLAQPGSRYTGNFNNSLELLTDVGGKPINLKVDYNMEGTPFYPAEYTRADLHVKSGKIYRGIMVKFNLMDNLLLLLMPDGKELVATNYIRRLVFTDTLNGEIVFRGIFERGFPAVDGHTEDMYYEVLDTGRLKLLKFHSVTYIDQRQYGQASITRVFEQSDTYYLYPVDGKMRKLEKGKDALLSLIGDKKDELGEFINQQNIKCRKESDWKTVIAYYNSLFTSPAKGF